MLTAAMVDGTHASINQVYGASAIATYVAGYDTGTPDIAWTLSDWAMFPTQIRVHIDQGGPRSPSNYATVRDVESSAWSLKSAMDPTGWVARRPTLYGSRTTIAQADAAGWTGDVWVAWPGYSRSTPPIYANCRCVAVQHTYAGQYDLSTVFDTTWPGTANGGTEVQFSQAQKNWKYCDKCASLYYGPKQPESVCPAGGHHDGVGSVNFTLPYLLPGDNQDGIHD